MLKIEIAYKDEEADKLYEMTNMPRPTREVSVETEFEKFSTVIEFIRGYAIGLSRVFGLEVDED